MDTALAYAIHTCTAAGSPRRAITGAGPSKGNPP